MRPCTEIIMADRDDNTKSNRGFASMDKETRERIARKGGEASHKNDDTKSSSSGSHGGSHGGSSGGRGGSSGSSSGGNSDSGPCRDESGRFTECDDDSGKDSNKGRGGSKSGHSGGSHSTSSGSSSSGGRSSRD